MNHLDEGTLHAHLDGELSPGEEERLRTHVEGCEGCARRLEEGWETLLAVRSALRGAPVAGATDEHRWEVRRRWARRRTALHRRRAAAAAAVLVLIAGGVAAAHPASPVRGWVASAWEELRGGPGEGSSAPASLAVTEEGERSGVGVELRDGTVVVEVLSAGPGTVVDARVTEGTRASLEVTGEARFRTAAGRLAAEIVSGDVEIGLPAAASAAEVRFEGRVLLRVREGAMEFPGAAPEEIEPGRVRFRLGGGEPR